jgi:hypothetical protein
MERGPRMENEGLVRTRETPERNLRRELRRNAMEIQYRTEYGSPSYEIARKISDKLDLKDHIDQMQQYRDDVTVRQTLKQLGIFMVKESKTRIEYNDPTTGFSIKPGDEVLDLHMPPVPQDQRTLSAATRSMGLIAEYMQNHNINPKYIIGITYERLARVSRFQRFTVVDIPIPDDIREGIERVYHKIAEPGLKDKPMGKIMLCYQTREDFMRRFSKPTSPTEVKIF